MDHLNEYAREGGRRLDAGEHHEENNREERVPAKVILCDQSYNLKHLGAEGKGRLERNCS